MGIYIDILVGNDFKLHRHNLALTRHPGCRDNLVAERVNILHGLPIHQVGSALNLDHGLLAADVVMAVLEVQAMGHVHDVLEEYITDRTVDDLMDGWVLSSIT